MILLQIIERVISHLTSMHGLKQLNDTKHKRERKGV